MMSSEAIFAKSDKTPYPYNYWISAIFGFYTKICIDSTPIIFV